MDDLIEGSGQHFLKTKELLDFQAADVAQAYLRDGYMFAWDTGTGKSIGAMALALLCLQDKIAEKVLLVCERNKLREWQEDLEAETNLSVRIHHGPSRWKKLQKDGLPDVLITTYETAKGDCATKQGGTRKLFAGPLLQALEDHAVLVIYDEVAKLRNRSSANYKAQEFLLRTLRKGKDVKVLGLTGTPIEKGYEDGFNQLRLLVTSMPLVKDFETDYVLYRDLYGRPTYRWNRIPEFVELARPHIGRKRKTDPDVIAQFPPLTENYRYVEMGADQRSFYRMIEDLVLEEGEESPMASWSLLRQAAGHPPAIIHSQAGERSLTARVIAAVGAEHITGLSSAKADELVAYLKPIMDQEAKAVVFTFFGQSILRDLDDRLIEEGLRVFSYHGGWSSAVNEAMKKDFKACEGGAVLLASDAAARGINLPEATHIIEFESALTHATRIQRRDRTHRLGSQHGPVTAMTFITEGTIEESIFSTVLRRNGEADTFLGDSDAEVGEEFVSAADRRQMLALAREHYRKRGSR